MEKIVSVIALVFAVSLAACQPKPENASAPTPIETIQQTTPASVESLPKPTVSSIVSKATVTKPTKTGSMKSKTATPRLDALDQRVKRLEDLARSYGANI